VNIELAKHGRGFLPADERAEQLHAGMGLGEVLLFKVLRVRSLQWHRKYFAICREIGLNQDPQRTEGSIDNELRVLAGHYDVLHVKGYEVRVPKRIAFDQMSADEWKELWPSLEQAIRERFGESYVAEAVW
jgi:hypothetical protein